RLRPPRRRRPDPRLLRPRPPPPARPRRRSAAQPRAARDHRQPPQEPPADDQLHRAQDPRGQERARGDPLPQALPRPPPLPRARGRPDGGLTLIEASPKLLSGMVTEGRTQSADHGMLATIAMGPDPHRGSSGVSSRRARPR